jgi:GAF domain-containing protein
MISAPIPTDDAQRLRALRDLRVLDTPAEERFDRVVRFAADEFGVPIALVSLVDEHRQWFKSKVGLDACSTARDVSLCGHAVVQDAVFVVEDALADERFADNPLVTGAPHIRFYAGAPLALPSGQRVGTLCLIDTRPRRLDDHDLQILASLRRLVVEELVGRSEDRA